MPRSKGHSPRVIRRIYAVLYEEPKWFERIVKEAGLSRKTVGKVLTYLVGKEMVKRHKEGTRTIYEIEKTLSPRCGWQIPWIRLIMTRRDWNMNWQRVDAETGGYERRLSIYNERLLDFLREKLIKPNQELAEILEELGMTGTPLIRFLEHLERPYCLECLKEGRGWIRTGLRNRKYICPCCELVAERVNLQESSPNRLYVLLRREWLEQMGLFLNQRGET